MLYTCTICMIKINHKKLLFSATSSSNPKRGADEMGSWSPLNNHQKQLAVEGSARAAIREGSSRQCSHHALVVQSIVLT